MDGGALEEVAARRRRGSASRPVNFEVHSGLGGRHPPLLFTSYMHTDRRGRLNSTDLYREISRELRDWGHVPPDATEPWNYRGYGRNASPKFVAIEGGVPRSFTVNHPRLGPVVVPDRWLVPTHWPVIAWTGERRPGWRWRTDEWAAI